MITRSSRHHHRHERYAAARQDIAAALASALSGRISPLDASSQDATSLPTKGARP